MKSIKEKNFYCYYWHRNSCRENFYASIEVPYPIQEVERELPLYSVQYKTGLRVDLINRIQIEIFTVLGEPMHFWDRIHG
jgi:hypothetical protein